VIEITPAQVHMHLLVLFRDGMPPIVTVGEPGVHGAVVTGTHGTGLPKAAMTAGFVGAVHIPNGGILTIGLKSMMFAAGVPSAVVRFTGSTIKLDGAIPKLHARIAPIFTCCGMTRSDSRDF
jgi:hypothetical protein